MHGVDVAQHQNAWLASLWITAHAQHVAEPVVDLEALHRRAGAGKPARDRVQHAIDAGGVAGGALDASDLLDIGEDGSAVDAAIEEGRHLSPLA